MDVGFLLRFLAGLAASIVLLAGCSDTSWVSTPACFDKRPIFKPLNPYEKKALAESQRRSHTRCSRKNNRCGFNVGSSPDETISVAIQRAGISQPGECVYIPGADIDMYDKNGTFVASTPGM